MYRKFIEILRQWQANNIKEPLMVVGARQVGKTWIIRKFCQETYDDYVYLNLEEEEDLRAAFDGNMDPETVISRLELSLGRRIEESTAIFIDEIQVSERAVTSLKYFCESRKNYRVICAGSLLGVKINRFGTSFPVGKVRLAKMYPMDFEEFLLAADEEILRDGIKQSFVDFSPLVSGAHNRALRLYHDYLFTGGMPKMVEAYIENGKSVVGLDPAILRDLRFAYMADMTKYVTSPAESVKISEIYNSIPRQLARENPKFKYSDVRAGGGKKNFETALDWLAASGMLYRINSLELPKEPLKGYENTNIFKVYLSDCGILFSLSGLKPRDVMPDSDNMYKGGVVENYVVGQMIINHSELYYYKPSDTFEVDLVYDDGNNIIPVEIKSGRHKRSTSLNNYCEKFKPDHAIRLSELNFGRTGLIWSVPLYAAFCI